MKFFFFFPEKEKMKDKLKIKAFNDNIASENSYLLVSGNESLVIDPGFNGEAIQEDLKNKGLKLGHVFLTHGHFDHIRDILLLRKYHVFAVHVHEKDKPMLYEETLNYARAFRSHFRLDEEQKVVLLDEHTRFPFGSGFIETIHTPGHTAGSVTFRIGNFLFTGDTLFSDGIGRTDLASGNQVALDRSLRKILAGCSSEMVVYPGHGEKSDLKTIRRENPFCRGL